MIDRRPLLLASLLVATGFVACNQIFGISSGTPEGSGGGHASTSSTSTSSPTSTTGASSAGASGGADASALLVGCVLLLHMDEPTWTSPGAVKDSSGQGNDGTAMGTATTTPQGKFGGAASFDGSGWIDVPNSASFQATDVLTYAAWVYPTGLGPPDAASAYPGIISKREGYAADVAFTMFIWFNNNVYADIEGARFNSDAGLTDGQWYHVAVVFDGPQQLASIYVNGALDTSYPTGAGIGMHDADVTVGFLPQGGYLDPLAFFDGRIDEVAIWTRALSASDIQSIYQAAGPL